MLWLLLLLADPPTVRLDEPPTVRLDYRGPGWFTAAAYADAWKEKERTRKPVFILFTDPVDCVPCRALDSGAFADERVQTSMEKFVCIRIDVTTPAGKDMAANYNVTSWPTIIVYKNDKNAGVLQGNACPAGMVEFLKESLTPARLKSSVPSAALSVGPMFHKGHDCPTCGHAEYRIDTGSMKPNGIHRHTCRKDGTTWYH